MELLLAFIIGLVFVYIFLAMIGFFVRFVLPLAVIAVVGYVLVKGFMGAFALVIPL